MLTDFTSLFASALPLFTRFVVPCFCILFISFSFDLIRYIFDVR